MISRLFRVYRATGANVASLLAVFAVLSFGAPAAKAQLYWDSNSTTAGAGGTPTGTWGTSANWNTDPLGGGAGAFQTATLNTDNLFFVAGPGAASGNSAYVVTVSGAQVANSLTFQASGTTTISGGTSITLGNGTAGAGGITMNQFAYGAVAQGAVTISTAIILANSQTWTNNSTSLLSFSGGVTLGSTLTFAGTGNFSATGGSFGNAGTGGIIMNGTGVLNLRQATNTNYTGSTTINSGIVLLNAASKSTGNFNLNGGMVTDYFQQVGVFSSGLGTGANQIQIYGNSGFGAGNGTSTWRIGAAGSVLIWGASGEGSATGFFNPTTLRFMTAADNLGPTIYGFVNFDNGLNLNGAARTISVLNASANPTNSGAQITGVISNGSLIKTGGGNLTLSNASNSYAGTTTISAGFLTVAASGALGSASNSLEFNGGTLRATGTITSPSTRSVTMTATGIIDNNGQAISIAGNIGGAGGLTKNGTGILTLSGTNGYGGVTTVNAGTLAITREVSLASNTAANLNVKSGAGLALNVDSAGTAGFTVANLDTLLGNILVANTAAQGLQAFAILSLDTGTATGGTFTPSSAITNSTGAFGGPIALTKLGAGTLVLNQANTYTLPTSIIAGTLQLDDGGAISAGPVLNNGTFTLNKSVTSTQGTNFGTIMGTGSLANIGAGTLVLNAPNFHTGTTSATVGNITISNALAIQNSALNTTGTGFVTLSGVATPTFGGLANSGATRDLATVISTGYGSVTNLTLNPQTGSTFTYGGVIADGFAGMTLTKTGAGTQVLQGTNAYTGETLLNAGTLTLSGNGTINTSTGLTFNGGGLTLINTSAAEALLDRVSSGAITANGGTMTLTNTSGANVYAETIGSVALTTGQTTFVFSNTQSASAGTQTLTLGGLTRTGATNTSSVLFASNSGLSTTKNMMVVTGSTATTSGQIIGPWAYTGNTAGASDYAVYNGSAQVLGANMTGTGQASWTVATDAYNNNVATQTLGATRTITALRNTAATATLTLATSANLETYGLLNGATTLFTVVPGTGGVLTTPTGGGNLHINAGNGTTGGAVTVSAPINNNSGNVKLVKNGSGTLTLTSTSSNFSGGVVLNAGTLSIDDVRSIGGTNNTGGSTATITVNGSSTISMPTNNLTANFGTGAITISNGATLTVNGSSRPTLIFGGAVTGSGGVTALSGSFWAKYSFTSTANGFTGAITNSTSGNDGIANALFSFNSIADVAGAGNIILNGAADSGIDYGSGASAPLNLNNRQIILANNNTVFFNNASSQAVNINTNIGFSGTGARQIRFGISGRNGAGTNTINGLLTDNAGGAFSPTFNGGLWVLTAANTYTGTTTVSAGRLSLNNLNAIANSSSVSVSSGATLGFPVITGGTYTVAGTISIAGVGTTLPGGAGALWFGQGGTYASTLNAPINMTAAATIGSFGVNMNTTLGGAIGGTGPLTISSQGGAATHAATWTLNAASAYSGNTIFNNNNGLVDITVKLGVDNALPVGTSLSLQAVTITLPHNAFTTFDLNGKNQTLVGLTDAVGAANAGATFNKRVINSSGTLATLTINNTAGVTYGTTGTRITAGTLGGTTAAGVAANNLALTKTGNGDLNLGGANTYTGNTSISAGRIAVTTAANLSSGATSLLQSGTGQYFLNGAVTYTNPFNLSTIGYSELAGDSNSNTNGAIRLGNGNLSGIITLSGNSRIGTFGSTVNTISGQITGSFGIDFYGFGLANTTPTFVISNPANNYTGNTTIYNNNYNATNLANVSTTLRLGASNVIPDGASAGNVAFAIVNSNNNATIIFDLASFSETINGLTVNAGTFATRITNSVAGASVLTIGANNTTSSFNGTITNTTGTLAITKIGSGTLNLSGTNTYTGPTQVNAGTLNVGVAGAGSTATGSAVTVGGSSATPLSTPTLGGTGTINGPVVIDSVNGGAAGILSPGASTGTLTVANSVTINDGGTYKWEIDNGQSISGSASLITLGESGVGITKDLLAITGGTNSLSATNLKFDITQIGVGSLTLSSNMYYSFTVATTAGTPSIAGTTILTTNATDFAAFSLTLDVTGNNIYLNLAPVVPEPGSVLAIAAVAFCVLARRRRATAAV